MRCYNRTPAVLGLALAVVASAARLGAAPGSPPADPQIQIVAAKIDSPESAQRVYRRLSATRGVKGVDVDLQTGVVAISLPRSGAASLEQLWLAVAEGDGGPTKLTTSTAAYAWDSAAEQANSSQPNQPSTVTRVMIDNLHCAGCAKKIAAKLYTLKGVTKVTADVAQNTLTLHTQRGVIVSPWKVAHAVGQAKERPIAVMNAQGKLTIEWATQSGPKDHEQAQTQPRDETRY